jgi:hypothetical protein
MLGSCAVLDALSSPRKPGAQSLDGLFPYAYHVNAGLFAGYLQEYRKTIRVTHVLDDVVGVNRDERSFVSSLALERGGDHPVEFLIDCLGFRSLILQQTLEEPFVSFQESLSCDRAIPMPIGHPEPGGKLPPFTTSIGLSADFDEFLFSVASDKNRLMAEAPDHRAAIAEIRAMQASPWYRPTGASADIAGAGGETVAIA